MAAFRGCPLSNRWCLMSFLSDGQRSPIRFRSVRVTKKFRSSSFFFFFFRFNGPVRFDRCFRTKRGCLDEGRGEKPWWISSSYLYIWDDSGSRFRPMFHPWSRNFTSFPASTCLYTRRPREWGRGIFRFWTGKRPLRLLGLRFRPGFRRTRCAFKCYSTPRTETQTLRNRTVVSVNRA